MLNYIKMEGITLTSEKRIFVLVGPSGSGKTTIGNELSKYGIKKLITTTTRPPRDGERDGVDYYFIDKDTLSDDAFLERTSYSGQLYGLTKAEVNTALATHQAVHVAMDKNGAKAMLQTYPEETFVIFIQASPQLLEKRMYARGDSKHEIDERIAFLKQTNEDMRPSFANLCIQNDDLQESVEQILHAS